MPSLIHALRYGRATADSMVISSDDAKALLTSETSLSIEAGCKQRRYMSPLSTVAVVSVPAIMNKPALTSISCLVSPALPLSSCLKIKSHRSTPSLVRPFSRRLVTREVEK